MVLQIILIPIANNIETLQKFVGIGDAQQLAPVIPTHKQTREDGTIGQRICRSFNPTIHATCSAGRSPRKHVPRMLSMHRRTSSAFKAFLR